MSPPIEVLLVEDHDMVREAMVAALAVYDDVVVVDTAASFTDAAALLSEIEIDVVVTDLRLGDGDGADLAPLAAAKVPAPAVLLITGTDDQRGVQLAIEAGCAGFISKGQGFDRLVDAIRVVAAGAAVFPADLLGRSLRAAEPDDGGLSSRELEVLQLLASARTIDEIAAELFLSPHTVRNHVKQVLSKLGAHSQLEAVVMGARRGLVAIT